MVVCLFKKKIKDGGSCTGSVHSAALNLDLVTGPALCWNHILEEA